MPLLRCEANIRGAQMSRYARARDANEPAIIRALELVGASVLRTQGREGEVDLVVGYAGYTYVMEVKNPDTRPAGNKGSYLCAADVRPGGEFEGMDPRLNRRQARWHKQWKGSMIAIVEYPHDALAHIGAPRDYCDCADCVTERSLP